MSANTSGVLLRSVALLASKATFIALRLLLLYLIALKFPPAYFGQIALAFSCAEFARVFADWGVDAVSVRQFSASNEFNAQTLFLSVILIKVMASLFAFLLSFSMIEYLTPSLSLIEAGLVSLSAVTGLWLNLLVNWFQTRHDLISTLPTFIVCGLFSFFGMVVATYFSFPISLFLTLLILFEVLLVFMLALRVRSEFVGFSYSNAYDLKRLIELLADATPVGVATLISYAYVRFDQYYISINFSPEILGDYSFSLRAVEPLILFVASVSVTLYVRMSFLVVNEPRKVRAFLFSSICRLVLFLLPVCIVLYFCFSSYFLPRYPQYGGVEEFIGVVLVCSIFKSINMCLTSAIQAYGSFGASMRINMLNFVFIVSLIYGLGSYWGAYGAVVAVLIGEIFNTFVQAVYILVRCRVV